MKKNLENITYCSIEGRINSPNIKLLLAHAEYSLRHFNFKVKILTPKQNFVKTDLVEFVEIEPINRVIDYSKFCVKRLNKYINTDFCLLYQWDGGISNPNLWSDKFLEFDYIGAPWPEKQFKTQTCMSGNGGFSLRSKKFLTESSNLPHECNLNEDVFLAITHRKYFEQRGIKFADCDTSKLFSVEQMIDSNHLFRNSFGFHNKTKHLTAFKEILKRNGIKYD